MENGRKLKSSDILKPGMKLRAEKIDFDDPEVQKRLEILFEEKKKCLERKKIDPKRLNLRIDI